MDASERTRGATKGPFVQIAASVSFEKACAVASPAITAWYALVEVARLQRGGKVFVHSASGATGQLASWISQFVGAEIFATVGYNNKKYLLVDSYGIPQDHILYSRNSSFRRGDYALNKWSRRGRGIKLTSW